MAWNVTIIERMEKTMVEQIHSAQQKKAIASAILHALPDWFGQPESTAEYIRESVSMPFWAAIENGQFLGFIALKETSPHTAEIYVMGVLPDQHRKGIGRQLFQALRAYAQEEGFRFLQVKTVREGRYAEYDRTNAFYRSMGFCELECFPQLWGESNPCQVYIQWIGDPNYQKEYAL